MLGSAFLITLACQYRVGKRLSGTKLRGFPLQALLEEGVHIDGYKRLVHRILPAQDSIITTSTINTIGATITILTIITIIAIIAILTITSINAITGFVFGLKEWNGSSSVSGSFA